MREPPDGYRVSFCSDEDVLELDGGEERTAAWQLEETPLTSVV